MLKRKLIRITTIADSLNVLLKGQLSFLSKKYHIIGVASGKNILAEIEEREGVKVVDVPTLKREINLLHDIVTLFRLFFLFIKEKPIIVHSNTPKASLLSMIAAWLARVPHRLYTVTGLRFETTSGMMFHILVLMERITCMCATKVIPEGDGVKNTLQKYHITKKPLQKILNGNINGVDLSYFSKNEELCKQAEIIRARCKGIVFCFVGRLVRDKGINELIEAFLKLYDEQKDATLLLVGPFEDTDPICANNKRSIMMHSAIKYEGFQKDVRPYLLAADVLVFPSYREGFPNVVLQAGAMELPSIVTNINGCNEIITDGVNGAIIPIKNTERLYATMKYYYSLPLNIRITMGRNARNHIEDKFEQGRVWQALLEMYDSLD